MGHDLSKREMNETLNQIRQDVSKMAKKTNAMKSSIRSFTNDTKLTGQAFGAAKRHFKATHYNVCNIVLDVCATMMDEVLALRNQLDAEFPLQQKTYIYKKLKEKLADLESQVANLNSIIDKAPKGADTSSTRDLLNSTKSDKTDYKDTIDKLDELDGTTAKTMNATKGKIASLKKAIDSIQTGYSVERGKVVFNNTIDADGLDLGELDTTYSDPKVMKNKFDPVNMATGNYIYNKTFLGTDGLIPLALEVRYNSADGRGSELSQGWSHEHMLRIDVQNDDVLLNYKGMFIEEYTKKEDEYINSRGYTNRILKKDEDGNGFIYIDEEKNSYYFNEDGECVKTEDEYGYAVEYGCEDGKLVSADTQFGLGLRFTYDDELLVKAEDLAGRNIRFKYEDDRLTQIIDECGDVYRYEYDEDGRMYKVINARGTENLINTYDFLNRVKEQEFPDEGKVRLAYRGNAVIATAQDGTRSEHIHDERSRSIETRYRKNNEEYSYDDANRLTREKDRNGNITEYEYDSRGNMIKEKTPAGDVFEYGYNEKDEETSLKLNGEEISRYYYNGGGRVIREIDALGREITADYDEDNILKELTFEDGSRVGYENDERGNITALTDENGNTTKYAYDDLNRVVEITDPNGNKESFCYNERSEISKAVNAKGEERHFQYNESGKVIKIVDYDGNEENAEYNELNKVSAYTDKDGNKTLYEYDKMWYLSKEIDPEGGIRLYSYDGDGNLMSDMDPNFNTVQYTRDGNGNVIKESRDDGNDTRYEYDAMDRLIHIVYKDGTEEHFEYDAQGNEIKFVDSAGSEWRSEYNLAGELTKRIDPEGLETAYEYDLRGRLIKEQTEGLVSCYEYDKAGNLIRRSESDGSVEILSYDANGNLTGRERAGVRFDYSYDCLDQLVEVRRDGETVTAYEYDKAGNIIAVTDAMGNVTKYIRSKAGDILSAIDATGHETKYEYDKCRRLISIDQGDGRVTKYERDPAGNVIAVTDALGNTERYEYDCNNEVTAKIDMDGNRTSISRNVHGDVSKIRYSDSSEIEYSYDALRRLKEVKDSLGVTSIERDAKGRETRITDHKGRIVEYSYDRHDNRTGITYPNGRKVCYGFDKYDRVTEIRSDDIETIINYDDYGRVRERRSKDIITSYAYDKLGRLSSLTHEKNGEAIFNESYSYDANDNIISDGASTYTYDKLGRLIKTAETSGKTCEYKYDAYGNRTYVRDGGNAATYLYNEANQLISTSEGHTFRYDKRGNLIEKALNGTILCSYIYGANNRLSRAENAQGKRAEYLYNGLGNRVRRSTGGKDVDYILDLTKMYNNLLEADGESYVWDEDTLIATDGGPAMCDRLGSPIRKTHSAGDSFGAAIDPTTLGFTGYMYDDISGTYFAQAREYVPEIGRFAGRDILKGEIEEPQSMNEYVYCQSDPVNYVDYDGMAATATWTEGQSERLRNNTFLKGGTDLVQYGKRDYYQIRKGIEKYKYNDAYSRQIDRENIARAKGEKPPAHQIRSGLTRQHNNTISKLNGKSAVAKKAGKAAVKKVGPGLQAAGVAISYHSDYRKGLTKSKRRTNLAVNVGFAVLGTAALFIPGVGWAAIAGFAVMAADVLLAEKIQNKWNSLD